MIYPGEFERMMQEIADKEDDAHYDYERTHAEADDLMCRVLEQLGYGAGIKIFDKMGKWYA